MNTLPDDETGDESLSLRGGLIVLAVAVVTRLLYFNLHAGSAFFLNPVLDERYYVDFARAIAAGADLTTFGGFRPILYPAFLSVFFKIAAGTFPLMLATLVQHALGIAASCCVAVAGARLARREVAGIAAGVLYALAPVPLYFEGEFLIESFLTFLVTVLFVIIGVACVRTPRSGIWWLVAGALTGLAAQARPNMLFFFPVFLAAAVWLWWRERTPGSVLPFLGLVGALMVQTLFGFVNQAQSGRYQWVTSAGGINLYVGNARTADGMIPRQARSVTYQGSGYRDSIQVYAEQEYTRATGLDGAADPGAVSRYWTSRTVDEIRADTPRWLGLMLKKAWLVLSSREVANNKSWSFIVEHDTPALVWFPARWWVLLALAASGLVALRRTGGAFLFCVVLFLAAYAASIALFFVNSRFRLPLWPGLSMLAGAGLIALIDAVRTHDTRRAAGLAGAALAATVISLPNWFAIPPDDFSRDYFFRSVAAYDSGNYALAARDAREAARLDPSNADIWLQLGNACYAAGEFDEARMALVRAGQLDPSEPRIWNNLGAVEEARKEPVAAYAAYRNALDVNPRHPTALANIALLEIRAGLYEDAEQNLAVLESVDAKRPELAVARALIGAQRLEPGATELLQKMMKEGPPAVGVIIQESAKQIPAEALREIATTRTPLALPRTSADPSTPPEGGP